MHCEIFPSLYIISILSTEDFLKLFFVVVVVFCFNERLTYSCWSSVSPPLAGGLLWRTLLERPACLGVGPPPELQEVSLLTPDSG